MAKAHSFSEIIPGLTLKRNVTILGAAAASLCLAIVITLAVKPHIQKKPDRRAAQQIRAGEEEPGNFPRKNYRMSVVAGGVYSAQELRESRTADRVVDEHYSDFGPQIERRSLPTDAYLYVSYRVSDHVYWTAQKHRIPKGELVLSDGKNLARTRCGNRLSRVPRQPVAPGKEPPEPMLSLLEPPSYEPTVPLSGIALSSPDMYLAGPDPGISPMLQATILSPKLTLPGLNSLGATGGLPPSFALSTPGAIPGKTATSSNRAPSGSSTGTTPPVAAATAAAVPEPASVFLAMTALGVLLLLRQSAQPSRKPAPSVRKCANTLQRRSRLQT